MVSIMHDPRKLALYIRQNVSENKPKFGDKDDNWTLSVADDACKLYLTSLDEHDHMRNLMRDCLTQLYESANGVVPDSLQKYIVTVANNNVEDLRVSSTATLCFLNMLLHDCVNCRHQNSASENHPLASIWANKEISLVCLTFFTKYAEARFGELRNGCCLSDRAEDRGRPKSENQLRLPYNPHQVLSDNKYSLLHAFLRAVRDFIVLSSIDSTLLVELTRRLLHALCNLGCRTGSLDDKFIAAECVAGLMKTLACSNQTADDVITKYACDADFIFMLNNCMHVSAIFDVACDVDTKVSDAAFLTVLVKKLHDACENNDVQSKRDATKFLSGKNKQTLSILPTALVSGQEYAQGKCLLCLTYLRNIQANESCHDFVSAILRSVAGQLMQRVDSTNFNELQPAFWRAAATIFDSFDPNSREVLWKLTLQNFHYEQMQTNCADFVAKYCLFNPDGSFDALTQLPQPVYESILSRALPKIYAARPELLTEFGHFVIKLYLSGTARPPTLERLIPLFRFMNKISTTTSPPFYVTTLSELLMSSGIVETLVTAENPQLTLYGSQLLFEWRRLRDPFSAQEAYLFELVCRHNMNRDYARFRQPFLRHIKKFFIRLRLSSIFLLKTQPDNEEKADETKSFLENHKQIVRSFVEQVMLCLEPGAWHARRATVLAIFETVVNVFTSDSKAAGETEKFSNAKQKPSSKASRSITYTDAYILNDSECNPLFFLNTNNLMLSLLHSLVSETNSTVQTSLISIIVGLSSARRSSVMPTANTQNLKFLTLSSIGRIVMSLMQSYRPRDSDVAVGFTRLALSLPRNRDAVEIHEQKRFVLNILDRFSALVEQVVKDQTFGLLKVLAYDPLHLILHVIRIVLIEISTVAKKNADNSVFSVEECQMLVADACKNCSNLVHSVSEIVNAQTSDTYEPLSMDFMAPAPCVLPSSSTPPSKDDNAELKMSAQALYVSTWRVMQNISYLFGDLCAHQLVQHDVELWQLIEQYFIDQLLQARHQGVFESAVDGYRQFIRSANPVLTRREADALGAKLKNDEQQVVLQNYIQSTPRRILSSMCCLLNDDENDSGPVLFADENEMHAKPLNLTIRLKTSNSRRSAGLPDLIMSALKCGFERGLALKRSSYELLDWLIQRILKVFQAEHPEEVSVERCVRFINVLTELLRDEALLEVTASHCGRALIMAIDGLQNPNWNINSASANLYAVLFNRLFSPRSNRPMSALTWRCEDTSLPAAELFGRYPEVFDYFYAVLSARVSSSSAEQQRQTSSFDVKTLCVTHIIGLLTTSCGDDQLGSSFMRPLKSDDDDVPRTLSSLTALLYAVAVGRQYEYELKFFINDDGTSRRPSVQTTDEAISRSACHAMMATLMPFPPPPPPPSSLLSPAAESEPVILLTGTTRTTTTANKIANDALAAFNTRSRYQQPRLLFELLRTVLVDYGRVYFGSEQQLYALRQRVLQELIGLLRRNSSSDAHVNAFWQCGDDDDFLRQHEAALNLLHALLKTTQIDEQLRQKAFTEITVPLLNRILSFCRMEKETDGKFLTHSSFANLRFWLNSVMHLAFDEKLSSRMFCCRWVVKLIDAVTAKRNDWNGEGDAGRLGKSAVVGLVLNFLVHRLNSCENVVVDEDDDGLLLKELAARLIMLFEQEMVAFASSHGDSSSSYQFDEQYVEAVLAAIGSCLTIERTKNDADYEAEAERDDDLAASVDKSFEQLSVRDNESKYANSIFDADLGRRLAVLLTRLINFQDLQRNTAAEKEEGTLERNKCRLLNRPAERLLRSTGVARQLTALIALLFSNPTTSSTASTVCSCREKEDRRTSRMNDLEGLPYAQFISAVENVASENESELNSFRNKKVESSGLDDCKACAFFTQKIPAEVHDILPTHTKNYSLCRIHDDESYALQTILMHCAYHESAEVRRTTAQIFMPVFISHVDAAIHLSKNCVVRTARATDDDNEFFPHFHGWFLMFDLLRDNSDAVRATMCEAITKWVAHDPSKCSEGEETSSQEESGRGVQRTPTQATCADSATQPCLSVLLRDVVDRYVQMGVTRGRLAQYALAAAVYLTLHEQKQPILMLTEEETDGKGNFYPEKHEAKKIINVFDASEAANYSDDCAFAVLLVKSFTIAFKEQYRVGKREEDLVKSSVGFEQTLIALAAWLLNWIERLLEKISSLSATQSNERDNNDVNDKALTNVFTTARQTSPLMMCALRMADAVQLLVMPFTFSIKCDDEAFARLQNRVKNVIAQILDDNRFEANDRLAEAARQIHKSLLPTQRLLEKLQSIC